MFFGQEGLFEAGGVEMCFFESINFFFEFVVLLDEELIHFCEVPIVVVECL